MDFELREWRETDIPAVAKYANNKKIADFLRDAFPFPYNNENAEEYVNACIKGDPALQYCRAITVDGQAVGSIGLLIQKDVYCRSAELGYLLGEPYWNKGIMSRAIPMICQDFFIEYEEIVRIFAEPFAQNIGSRRVLEKSGFQLEGILRKSVYKNGYYFDSCIYALIREENGQKAN